MSARNGSDELSQGRDPGLPEYLEILRRRWAVLLAPVVIGLGIALAVTVISPRVYRATATVTIDRSMRLGVLDTLGDLSSFADQSAQGPDIETLIELSRSGTVRRAASALIASRLPGPAPRPLGSLRVQQVRDSELVSLSVEHTEPAVAAVAANAVAEAVIEMSLTDRRRPVSEARQFISAQLTRESQRLRATEDALVAFKDSHGDVALAAETALNLQKLAGLEAQQVDLRVQREEIRGQISRARAKLSSQARISPTQWTPSPLIVTLQRELASLEITLSGLRREFTARHPSVLSTQAKIDETRRRLNTELTRSLQTHQYGVDPVYQDLIQQIAQAEVTGAALDARDDALRRAIAQYAAKVRGVPAREAELARLTRTVQEAEKTYLLLSDKLQDAQIAEASIGSAIRFVDRAGVPSSPARPRPVTNLLLALMVGAIVGGVGVFLFEQLDDTAKSAEEVEDLLGAPVLGALPVIGGRQRRNGHTPPLLPRLVGLDGGTAAAEALRTLRTHVLLSSSQAGRCLIVTSALRGEGKSTVAASLAVAVARTARKVWLVNGDLRHPTLGRLFPQSTTLGLAHVLTADGGVASVVRPTFEPNLVYTDSGPPVANPAELWSGHRAARLISEGREHADVILIDSPPLLTVTDAELISRQTDGCLLVVKVGGPTRRALIHVRQRLERAGVTLVGVVLNFAPHSRRSGYHSSFDAFVGPDGGPADGSTDDALGGTRGKTGLPTRGVHVGRAVVLGAFLVAALAATALLPGWGRRSGDGRSPMSLARIDAVAWTISRTMTGIKLGVWSYLRSRPAGTPTLQGGQ